VNSGWDYVSNRAAFEFVFAQRPAERLRLKMIFESLVRNPAVPVAAYTQDDIGRKLSIIYREGFRITFWVDHFAREVRLVDVRRA
jgi:hypothetical protein